MKNVFLFFTIIFSINRLQAQIPDYYVYLVKGNVYLSKSNTKQALKQGDFIFLKDIISVDKNSEVTIVNKDEKYAVLNTPGVFKTSTFNNKFEDYYSGITKKYLALVWEEVLDPDYDLSKFKKKNLTESYGGVFRGDDCKNLVFPVNGLKASQDSIQFRWRKTSASGNYNFFIYDGDGKQIFQTNVKDTQTIISANKLQLPTGKYYWLIKGEGSVCEEEVPLYFQLMNRDDEQALINSFTGKEQEKDLISALELADKLEKNAMIYAAKKNYQELLNKYPGNKTVLQLYVLFLLKYEFSEEAVTAWNAYKK
jgi:hypothetical protein